MRPPSAFSVVVVTVVLVAALYSPTPVLAAFGFLSILVGLVVWTAALAYVLDWLRGREWPPWRL